jgi:hypothetical protein
LISDMDIMITILSALASLLSFRVRRRASLEFELVALRHQVTVLRRQRPGQLRLVSTDRLLWVWLYRVWPQVLNAMVLVKNQQPWSSGIAKASGSTGGGDHTVWDLNAMVLVKPATVVQWHRKGFRLYWRWRSHRLGQPKLSPEIRDLIRRMSLANPLWGAPPHPRRTAQAWHRGQPSHGWEIPAVAAQSPLPDLAQLSAQPPDQHCGDRHVRCGNRDVSSSLCPDRPRTWSKKNPPFRGHPKSDTSLAIAPNDRGLSLGHRAPLRDRDASYGPAFRDRVRVMGIKEVVTAPRSP